MGDFDVDPILKQELAPEYTQEGVAKLDAVINGNGGIPKKELKGIKRSF